MERSSRVLLERLETGPRDAWDRHNEHTDRLLQQVVRRREGKAVLDKRVCLQRLVDLNRGYDFSPPVDDVLVSSSEVEVAVLIHLAHVARHEPAAGVEALCVGLRVVLVAPRHWVTLEADVADGASRQLVAGVVLDLAGRPDDLP